MGRLSAVVAGALGVALLAGCLSQTGGSGSSGAAAFDAPPTPCEVCHLDIHTAFLGTKHGQANQTCATCHGRSARHSWSEDGHVPPDRPLKSRAQVDALCTSCHKIPKHSSTLSTDRKCSACHDSHPRTEDEPDRPVSREDLPDEV